MICVIFSVVEVVYLQIHAHYHFRPTNDSPYQTLYVLLSGSNLSLISVYLELWNPQFRTMLAILSARKDRRYVAEFDLIEGAME